MMQREPKTDGTEFSENDGRAVATELPASRSIHAQHQAAVRLGKGALVNAIEAGALLQEERSRRGEEFEEWVDKELGLSRDEADCYIHFFEESGLSPAQLSPTVEVKLSRVLDLLGQLNNAFDKGAVLAGSARTTDRARRRQKVAVSTDGSTKPSQQPPKPKEAKSRAGKTSKVVRERTAETPAKVKPGQQDCDGQSALTPEQRQLLFDYSPRLFARVMTGKVELDEALRVAGGSVAAASQNTH